MTDTPDGYRTAVRYLKSVKIEFHTFQPKEEKPFRVVIRGLHHTVPVELIKSELEELGFKIRNVSNVIINRHGTKIPRPFFFVDLEANENNHNIFQVQTIMLGIISPGKRRTPGVKTLLSAFILCQQTPLVYTSNIPRHLRQPNLCYIKKNSHRNSNRNRNICQSNHSGDHNARAKILTPILGCFHNRNHAQGCHNNSNCNISKPSLDQAILLDPIIPDHQFGFRNSHSTIQQCQRVVDNTASCLKQKQYCSAAFLDVAQAFDRVWHQGLLRKIKSLVPSTYYLILLSYLTDRYFIVIHGSSQPPYFPIKAGVPQGSILSPQPYSVYTSDIPEHPATLLASFADDTAILSTNSDPTLASPNLQSHLTTLQTWCSNWKIRVNPQKCVHVTFTLRHSSCPPVYWHRTELPPAKVVRYLGLYIDRTLTWNPHTRLKRQERN
ncbi:hypothetical protein AAG570_012923 [Ranatra chinensis]|uniref:Reverse transcriptase domain-containing protein n=1 Tax=Ranatra chinensis TaxID=642074 RepID=A0ABD0YH65_9HEMI